MRKPLNHCISLLIVSCLVVNLAAVQASAAAVMQEPSPTFTTQAFASRCIFEFPAGFFNHLRDLRAFVFDSIQASNRLPGIRSAPPSVSDDAAKIAASRLNYDALLRGADSRYHSKTFPVETQYYLTLGETSGGVHLLTGTGVHTARFQRLVKCLLPWFDFRSPQEASQNSTARRLFETHVLPTLHQRLAENKRLVPVVFSKDPDLIASKVAMVEVYKDDRLIIVINSAWADEMLDIRSKDTKSIEATQFRLGERLAHALDHTLAKPAGVVDILRDESRVLVNDSRRYLASMFRDTAGEPLSDYGMLMRAFSQTHPIQSEHTGWLYNPESGFFVSNWRQTGSGAGRWSQSLYEQRVWQLLITLPTPGGVRMMPVSPPSGHVPEFDDSTEWRSALKTMPPIMEECFLKLDEFFSKSLSDPAFAAKYGLDHHLLIEARSSLILLALFYETDPITELSLKIGKLTEEFLTLTDSADAKVDKFLDESSILFEASMSLNAMIEFLGNRSVMVTKGVSEGLLIWDEISMKRDSYDGMPMLIYSAKDKEKNGATIGLPDPDTMDSPRPPWYEHWIRLEFAKSLVLLLAEFRAMQLDSSGAEPEVMNDATVMIRSLAMHYGLMARPPISKDPTPTPDIRSFPVNISSNGAAKAASHLDGEALLKAADGQFHRPDLPIDSQYFLDAGKLDGDIYLEANPVASRNPDFSQNAQRLKNWFNMQSPSKSTVNPSARGLFERHVLPVILARIRKYDEKIPIVISSHPDLLATKVPMVEVYRNGQLIIVLNSAWVNEMLTAREKSNANQEATEFILGERLAHALSHDFWRPINHLEWRRNEHAVLFEEALRHLALMYTDSALQELSAYGQSLCIFYMKSRIQSIHSGWIFDPHIGFFAKLWQQAAIGNIPHMDKNDRFKNLLWGLVDNLPIPSGIRTIPPRILHVAA